ncbi:glycoside hydrolase family 5 protein [Cellvibrio japonicus]|nr:glycoside hydrolase family 5 protein [Cellvibrio japonicus]
MNRINTLVFSCLLVVLAGCGSAGGGSSGGASSSIITPSSSDTSSLSSSASSTSSLSSASSLSSSSSSSSSLSSAGLYPSYNTSPAAPDSTGMQSTAVQLAGKIRLGWNIGNTMEAIGGETAWGNPMVSNELLKLVKDSGFDAVRIPVAWDQYANQESAEISAAWLNRVKQVVQMAIDNELYVLINIHWDGGWLENNITPAKKDENNAKQKAFWEQIATHLRDFDEHLLFAGTNEPNAENAEQMDVLNSYLQTFVDAVRSTGGKNAYRVLVLQGPVTDIEKTNELWTHMPADTATDRLMAEVHFYTPYNFALMRQDESWGKQFYYWGEGFLSTTDTERNPTWGEEATIDQLFDLMKTKFVDQGIPVVLGEFSAMRRTNLTGDALTLHLAGRAYYHKYVTQQALARGLLPFYWDNGGNDNFSSGIFNRQQNTVFDQQVLDALLEGAGAQ